MGKCIKGKARLAEIETLLSDNEEMNLARSQAESSEEAYITAQRELKRAEQEVASQNEKIENNQTRGYKRTVHFPDVSKSIEDIIKRSKTIGTGS